MFIVTYKKIFIILSLVLMTASLGVVIVRGFNLGIDFTGGSILEVSYEERPSIARVHEVVDPLGFSSQIQEFGDSSIVVRSRDLSEEEREALVETLSFSGESVATLERFNSIGPSIGKELRTKALWALIVVALAIILFVAYAFRSTSGDSTSEHHVSSWRYGVIAVVALLHDVLIPAGIYSLVGGQVDSLFVVGILSILGLSVNDTIVVFDRIRENIEHAIRDHRNVSFAHIVGESISQTVARSINTSLTLLVVLIALLVAGPASTYNLALVMLFGTIAGTYSSIFFASPLLVWWNERNS